jgi:signal peptidase II
MTPARLGFWVALATFALDQASKLYLLYGYDLPVREPLVLAPFLELVVVWNQGMSYGLFKQNTEVGRWALVAVQIAAAVGLSLWMVRASGRILVLSLALIVGGAAGNALDRIVFGAVFDFVHFHVGAWSWYVFNVADAAIVAGVIGLLYDALVLERQRTGHAGA